MSGTNWASITGGAVNYSAQIVDKFEWLNNSIVPLYDGNMTNAAYDLGESSFQWRYGYMRSIYADEGFTVRAQSFTTTSIIFHSDDSIEIKFDPAIDYLKLRSSGTVQMFNSTPYIYGVNDATGHLDIYGGTDLSNTLTFDINPTGAVTVPLSPMFSAYISTATVYFDTSTVGLKFDTLACSVGGGFNKVTSTYTPPLSGLYLIGAEIFASGASATFSPPGRIYLFTSSISVSTLYPDYIFQAEPVNISEYQHISFKTVLPLSTTSKVYLGRDGFDNAYYLGTATKSRFYAHYLG